MILPLGPLYLARIYGQTLLGPGQRFGGINSESCFSGKGSPVPLLEP